MLISQLDFAQRSSFGPLRIGYSFYSFGVGGGYFGPPGLFWYSEYYNYECIGLKDYTSKYLPLKCNACTYYKMAHVPYFYFEPK